MTRRDFNAGMILMLDDKLRTALLDNKSMGPRRSVESERGINEILTDMSIDGHVEIDSTGDQQIVRIGPHAPSTDDVSVEETQRIDEARKIIVRFRPRCQYRDSNSK
jgi:hypothetical protein